MYSRTARERLELGMILDRPTAPRAITLVKALLLLKLTTRLKVWFYTLAWACR